MFHFDRFNVPSGITLMLALLQGCSLATPNEDDLIQPSDGKSTLTVGVTSLPPPVQGFADLHNHMMAEDAFAGAWLHGKHAGPGALDPCDGGFPPSDHARLRQDLTGLLSLCPNGANIDLSGVPLLSELFSIGGAVGSEFIGKIEGTEGDTGLHLNRPTLGSGWPRWDTIAHQQVWEGWLQTAHSRGLNLVVISAVSNDFLCNAMPSQNRKRACDEMVDVELQIRMATDFAAQRDWVDIALSPAHARQIINAGKLAMVLSIETSHLFGSADMRTELGKFYDLGVRTLQPVHQLDNRFGGAAPHNPILQVAQFTENCHIDFDCGVTTSAFTLGFDVDSSCRNTKGLTTEGKSLLQEMMNKGMLIDLAHLSERGIQDAYGLAQQNSYYPLYISHGHFREVMNPELASNEKTTPAWVIQDLRRTGGMFGLRTAHDETRAYTKSGVANNCQGSSRSFAQAYEFGRQGLKIPMAFGADLNGFIQQTRPRFGSDGACSATFKAEADSQARLQKDTGPSPLGTEFDQKGLAHVGLLPDLITDLKHLGVNTSSLENSAETFIRMWERATSVRSGMADPANDIDTSGVAAYVSREDRENLYPEVCGSSYSPGYQDVGGACYFDPECSSGKCSAATCSTSPGICLCTTDSQCGTNQYCGYALNSGKCQNKKGSGSACLESRECLTYCRLTITGPRCK